jgi:threonine/homoserine/homoserine lactone efflux protein
LLVGYAIRYSAAPGGLSSASPPATGCILFWPLSAGASAPGAAAVYRHRAAGRGYLLWIGSLLLQAARDAGGDASASRPSRVKQLLLGLGSSLLNPKNALFYLALMTSLLGPDVTLLQQAVSGVWMTSVVLLWDLLLVTMIALPQCSAAFPPSSGASSGRRAAS